MAKKIIAGFLIGLGLVIIVGSLYYTFLVFLGRESAPQIFKLKQSQYLPSKTTKISSSPANISQKSIVEEKLQNTLQKNISVQLQKMFPPDFMPKLLNLIVFSIFVAILIFGGEKISFLGIKLLK